MTALRPIAAADLASRLKQRNVTLVDIREADEYAREHIDGAVSVPLSQLERSHLAVEPKGEVVFTCKSGMRTGQNCERLAALVDGDAFLLEGGLDAWKRAGLRTHADARAPLELNRQVQISIGALTLIGVALTALVNPGFVAIPALLGAGLLFAGLSGWCGMAHLLALAPWNRRRTQ